MLGIRESNASHLGVYELYDTDYSGGLYGEYRVLFKLLVLEIEKQANILTMFDGVPKDIVIQIIKK